MQPWLCKYLSQSFFLYIFFEVLESGKLLTKSTRYEVNYNITNFDLN